MRFRPLFIIGVSLSLSLGLAACGDDDSAVQTVDTSGSECRLADPILDSLYEADFVGFVNVDGRKATNLAAVKGRAARGVAVAKAQVQDNKLFDGRNLLIVTRFGQVINVPVTEIPAGTAVTAQFSFASMAYEYDGDFDSMVTNLKNTTIQAQGEKCVQGVRPRTTDPVGLSR